MGEGCDRRPGALRGKQQLRVAVIGHVEHVTIGSAPRLPTPGEIVHLDDVVTIPGGGGGLAFFQLRRGPAEVHLFTAVGNDDAAQLVSDRVRATSAAVHIAYRNQPHTRDLVVVTPDGERTIFVQGEPLHPVMADPLPWDLLHGFDAIYCTAQDPQLVRAARASKVLVVTSRRFDALARSGVQADVVVGSWNDPREAHELADFVVPPKALVMTKGKEGGVIKTVKGIARFRAPQVQQAARGAYGAGDSFAGALTWYVACGLGIEKSCARAAECGAAVLRDINPLDGQVALTLV